ncbi:MAG: UbiD family decarboxylase [Acidilobaceae archaeon]
MPLRDLREALEKLNSKGMLRKVKAEVDPNLEVAEIARRVMYARGPTLLFENIKGYPGWRMSTNLFRDLETIKMLLNVESLENLMQSFLETTLRPPPSGLLEKLGTLREVLKIGSLIPKRVSRGLFEDNVIEERGFDKTPIPKTWPKDAGRYITYGLVLTKDPDTGVTNMGVYRVQIIDSEKAVVHWHIHKRGALAWSKAKELGKNKIKVAIAVGSDPGTMLTGALPVPYPLDKLLFASLVRGAPLEYVEIEDVPIPANAEVVYLGEVFTDVLVDEGPFGDHTGYYSPVGKYPLFKLERVYHRDDPIFYFTVVGKPVLEDAWIGKAAERIFLPLIKTIMPEVIDVNLPPEGLATGGIAIVSIKKRYPGQAKKVMMGLWGLGLFSLVKMIIVVDHDVNVNDWGQVAYAIATCVDPQRDVLVVPNVVTDALDHAAPYPGYGSKLGIDATRKLPEENYGREWPEEVQPDPETVRLVNSRWKEYGIDL